VYRDDEVVDRLGFRRYLPIYDLGARESSSTDEVCVLLFLVIQSLEMGFDGEGHDSRWVVGEVLLPCGSI